MKRKSFVVLLCLWLCLAAWSANSQPIMLGVGLQRKLEQARKKVYPALVNITVVMRYFYGGRAERFLSWGSGVIVSAEGHVLTNYHVVKDATRIICTLTTGESIEASLITRDPLTDLSVLKLLTEKLPKRKERLPYAKLGDSEKLRVGDYVLAMGNPLALTSSVTLGIVSNPRRVFTDVTATELEELELAPGEKTGLLNLWIQHDALVLPGNSGGPLVNLKGEVIGINTRGGAGVGFAIPSNTAKKVLQQALKFNEVRRSWLGITVLPVEKLGEEKGALISSVSPGSPAEEAGIKPGDILIRLDGEPVYIRFFEQVPLLYHRIADLPIGKEVSVEVLRENKEHNFRVKTAPLERFIGDEEEFRDMGVTVKEITTAMAIERRLPDKNGVLITGLRPGYPFEDAQPRLQVNDVIISIDGKPTPNLVAFRDVLTALKKEEIAVGYRRGFEQLVTVVKVKKTEPPATLAGELPKPWLGIKTQVLTPEVAKALNFTVGTKGFRVTEVYPDTEAYKSGLQVGDIITAVNGEPLKAYRLQDAQDLKRKLEDFTIGEKVELSILRNGSSISILVVLEAEPAGGDTAKRSKQKEFEFTVRNLTLMDYLQKRLQKDLKGVLVAEVASGGWAHVAGLHVDDIIISINRQPTENVDKFEEVMKQVLAQRPRVVSLFVRRGAKTHFVFIEPDWAKLIQ